MAHTEENPMYGVLAEFKETDELIAAAAKVRDAGYTKTDGFSSIPVHGLFEALGGKRSILPWVVFCGGLLGGLAGFGLQAWINCIEYPMNVGGRPYLSWPSFIPVTFECTILGAALSSVFYMFGRNGFPQPYHPVFNSERFKGMTTDRFFLIVETDDPKFNEQEVTALFQSLQAVNIETVEK